MTPRGRRPSWPCNTNTHLRLLSSTRSLSLPLALSGLYLVTAGTDGVTAVWDVPRRAVIAQRRSASPVTAAAWHPTDNSLALQVACNTQV